MGAERVRLKVVEVAQESTYGTDASPTTSDGVPVEENFWSSITVGHLNENLRDQLAGAGLGRAGTASATGQFAEIELVVPMKGPGSAYSAEGDLSFNPLLEACGMTANVVTTAGSETVTYTPSSTTFESATIYAYSGHTEYQLVGCRGNVAFILTPGQIGRMRFSLQGMVSAINDAALPSITYANKSVTPPTVTTAGLTMNSHDPSDFSDWELDLQNNIVQRPRGNASDAHAGYVISDRDPQFTTTIDRPTLSSFNPWDLRKNGTTFSWDIGKIGGTQYNQYKISGPAGRIIDVPQSEDNGLAMLDLTVRAQNTDVDTSDDDVSVEFS